MPPVPGLDFVILSPLWGLQKGLYSEYGALPSSNVCHSLKVISVNEYMTNFFLLYDHRYRLVLFKALPKANHLPLKQEEIYDI